ncbi:hypothetical protein [Cellvibrio fontiphilus]|uniref:Uncharacterized protein n=1 Tax=Cellvibrio fontiphilus TaxID=1815559 RepID=A0ABV7FEC8_9GAMM
MKYTIILFIALAISNAASVAHANDCGRWQSKLKSTERKLVNGGNQSERRQWEKEKNYYAKTLENCHKKKGSYHWIQTTSNTKARADGKTKTRKLREKRRTAHSNDPRVQQLINTCNFWIEEYQANSSEDNQTLMTTACRHADQITTHAPAPTQGDKFVATRPLKACVKSGNVIDDDVKNCMLGKINPTWKMEK